MADINIFALGGQDENGKDLFVIEVENDIFIINAGIKFPIKDIWGVDAIIADTEYLQKNKNKIKGLFITHAHDEAFAALPWILMDFPGIKIYGSKFTIEVAKNRVSKYKIGHSKYEFHVMENDIKIGKTNIKSFNVANSIPGSLAYNFQTPDGDIIFMSNMTIDDLGVYGKTDLKKIKNESNNIIALMLDSRTSNFNGHSSEKKSVKPLIEDEFKKAKENERILIGAYDEEMYILQEVIELANKYNRPVSFYGSAFDNLYSILKSERSDFITPKNTIDFKSINNSQNAVVLVTGTWSRLYQRFQRIATGNDVFLKLKKYDHFIGICPPINGMEVEYAEALDEITKTSPNILSISDKDFYKLRPTKDDIKEIVSILSPKIFIPISSLYRYQVVANEQAESQGVDQRNTILLNLGKIIYIKDGEIASQKGKIKQIGDVIIQGFGVGDVSFEVIQERKVLSSGGVVSISVQVDKKKKQLVGDMNIQIIGVAAKSEINRLNAEVQSIVIEKYEQSANSDYRDVQNSIRKRVQKVISRLTNKEPLVVITFYEV